MYNLSPVGEIGSFSIQDVRPNFKPDFEIHNYQNFDYNKEGQEFQIQSEAFYQLERLAKWDKIAKNVMAIETLHGVDEDIKKRQIEDYLEKELWEYEDILKDYRIEARN